jgi:uncharacterized Zn ribbon protein
MASRGAIPIAAGAQRVVRDANGRELQDGETVTVVRDLKVKGSSQVVNSEQGERHPPGRR